MRLSLPTPLPKHSLVALGVVRGDAPRPIASLLARSRIDLTDDDVRGSLRGCPVLPGNQVAVDDDNILVLLTGNILRTGSRQPFLRKPRRALRDSEIDHFGVRKSGHLLAGKGPRPIFGACAKQRGYAAADCPDNLPLLPVCLGRAKVATISGRRR
jgi:hypothetical protein